MNEKAIRLLLLFHKKATREIIGILNSASIYTYEEKIKIQKEVNELLQITDEKTKKWLGREVRDAYKAGGKLGVNLLLSTDLDANYKYTKADHEVVQTLIDGAAQHFAEAMSGVTRFTTQLLDEATKQRIRSIIAEGVITKATRKEISDRIAGELKDGLIALRDRGGREWKFETYSEMLARTQLVKAGNEGMLNQLAFNNYDLVQVTDHFGSCDVCAPWEGKILSITGQTPGFETIQQAEDAGLFHPNCKHRYVPYHPDIADKSRAWSTHLQRYI